MSRSDDRPADATPTATAAPETLSHKTLSPAAQRALAEAEARRAEIDRKAAEMPKEWNGRDGLEPVRYGDWEKKGLAVDF